MIFSVILYCTFHSFVIALALFRVSVAGFPKQFPIQYVLGFQYMLTRTHNFTNGSVAPKRPCKIQPCATASPAQLQPCKCPTRCCGAPAETRQLQPYSHVGHGRPVLAGPATARVSSRQVRPLAWRTGPDNEVGGFPPCPPPLWMTLVLRAC